MTGIMIDDDTKFDVESAPIPRDMDLNRVSELAERLRAEEAVVIAATEALSAALIVYRATSERELPEAMAACGLSEFRLIDGVKIGIETRFVGGKLVDPVALDWVEANGGQPLIKTTIVVELPTNEIEIAREILNTLKQHPKANQFVRLELERSVHQSTIAAFAKELVEARKNPPLDTLGVMRRVTARVGARRPRMIELKGLERR